MEGTRRNLIIGIFFIILNFLFFNFVKAENIIDVPFITQFPPGTSWYDTLNCGPTSYLMIDSFYTGNQLSIQRIKDVDDWLNENYNQPINNYNGYYTQLKDLKNIGVNFGNFYFDDIKSTFSLEDIKETTKENYPVIVFVYTNMLSLGKGIDQPHFMVITGISGDTVYTNDPGKTNGKNKAYPLSQFLYAWGLQDNAALIFYPPGHSQVEEEKTTNFLQNILGFKENIFDWNNWDLGSKESAVLSENEEVKAEEVKQETIVYNASILNKNKTIDARPGQIIDIAVEAKNTGNTDWQRNYTSLNVVGGKIANQKFYTSSWKTDLRPTLVDGNVGVGETGKFSFQIKIPEEIGNYNFRTMIVRQSGTQFTQIGSDIFSLQINVSEEKEIELVEEPVIIDQIEKNNVIEDVKQNIDIFVEKINDVVEDVVDTIKNFPTYLFGGGSSGGSNIVEENVVENTQEPELFFTITSSISLTNLATTTISGEKSIELIDLEINGEEKNISTSGTSWSVDIDLVEGINDLLLSFYNDERTKNVTGTLQIVLDSIAPEMPVLSSTINTDDSPQVNLSWQSSDEGVGVAYYVLHYKNIDEAEWQTILENTTSTEFNFSAEIGNNYNFRVKAVDLAGNESAWSSDNDAISVDWSKEVVINEIAYAPTYLGGCGGDWLELYNPSELDLSEWTIEILLENSSSTVEITSSSTEKYFVVSNLDVPDSGAQIILKNPAGKIIDETNQANGWFVTNPFNHARSLERISSNISGNIDSNWRINNSLRASLYNISCGQDFSSRGFANEGYTFLAGNLADNYIFETVTSTGEYILTLNKNGNPYILDEIVTIPEGYTLVLDSGVVVVGNFSKAHLFVNGNLIIEGTSDNPVYFTSSKDKTVGDWGLLEGEPAPGDWSAIIVKAGGRLDANYTNFNYGGYTYRNGDCFVCYAQQVVRNEGGNVILNNSSFDNIFVKDDYDDVNDAYVWSSGGNLAIDNSNFQNGYQAVKISDVTNLSISNSSFRNFSIENNSPLYLGNANLIKWENNIFENNSVNLVTLPTLNITEDYTLTPSYNSVLFNGINVSSTATLTILPGVDVNLAGNTWLKVEGNLQALGEEGNLIRFCPNSACAGLWFQDSSDNLLDYVDIRNAGYHSQYPFRDSKNYTAPIWTINSGLAISNSSIMDNRSPTGFDICSTGSDLDIRDSEFGWSYDWRTTHYTWVTGGIKLLGGSLNIENTDFHFMNYAIDARFGEPVVTYDNMSSANFFNMYEIPHHSQNWLPYELFSFSSY